MTAVRRLPTLLAPLALAAAVALAGCADEGSAADGGAAAPPVVGVTEVIAKDSKFKPGAVQVPAGTTVTWRFQDGFTPHDVTGEGWKSGQPQRKGSFAHAFAKPGTYPYRCTLHEGMDGRVVVTAA